MFFTPYDKYGKALNSHDLLKFIAIITMVVDHLGHFYFKDIEILRAIGRTSFPIFLFLAGYSLNYKTNYNLIFLAIAISIVDAGINYPIFPLNILYSIIFTRLFLLYLEKKNFKTKNLYLLFAFLLLWLLPTKMLAEYGTLGVMFAICGNMVKTMPKSKKTRNLLIATIIIHFLMQDLSQDFSLIANFLVALILTILVITFYNYNKLCNFIYKLTDKNRFILAPILYISRNSLQLYFLHLIILKAGSVLLFSEDYLIFRIM